LQLFRTADPAHPAWIPVITGAKFTKGFVGFSLEYDQAAANAKASPYPQVFVRGEPLMGFKAAGYGTVPDGMVIMSFHAQDSGEVFRLVNGNVNQVGDITLVLAGIKGWNRKACIVLKRMNLIAQTFKRTTLAPNGPGGGFRYAGSFITGASWGDINANDDPLTKEPNPSAESTATSINDQSEIIGDADTGYGSVSGNPRGVYHAVLWRNDTISDLGTLNGFPDSTAVKINATGLILGRAIQQEDGPRTHRYKDRTFLYKGGRLWPVPDSFNDQDVNDQGQGVGWRRRSGRVYVVLSNHQRVHELGPVVRGYVVENLAINNSGRIAMTLGKWNGENDRSSYGLIPSQALVWQSGRWQKLSGLPSQPETVVSGMNSSGLIVGQTRTILSDANSLNQDATAVLWQNGSVKDLNQAIAQGLGWKLKNATNINNQGQIVGFGIINGQSHAFLLSPLRK